MAVADQVVTDKYAVYNGDSCEVLPSLKDGSVHLSIYSPPFATPKGGALYHYSSSDRDLSNARTLPEFMRHYEFIVSEISRLTMPGRMTCVHTTDVAVSNTGRGDSLFDLSGEIVRLHERLGWAYVARYSVWKEPLTVRNRTMTKALAHKSLVDDSSRCTVASADTLLVFRKAGENPVPITHPVGLLEYAGERKMPVELLQYRGWKGNQTENRYSHWIWRQYASAFWDDIRLDRVVPFKAPDGKKLEDEDEKHLHPLQLDVIDRALVLWSNPGETVLTPFMGVGSEVYSSVRAGRRGIGIELKPSYYRQAVKNVAAGLADANTVDPTGQRLLAMDLAATAAEGA